MIDLSTALLGDVRAAQMPVVVVNKKNMHLKNKILVLVTCSLTHYPTVILYCSFCPATEISPMQMQIVWSSHFA